MLIYLIFNLDKLKIRETRIQIENEYLSKFELCDETAND